MADFRAQLQSNANPKFRPGEIGWRAKVRLSPGFSAPKIPGFSRFSRTTPSPNLGENPGFSRFWPKFGLGVVRILAKNWPKSRTTPSGNLGHFWRFWQNSRLALSKNGPILAIFGPFWAILALDPSQVDTFWALFSRVQKGSKKCPPGWGDFPEINFSRKNLLFPKIAEKTPGALRCFSNLRGGPRLNSRLALLCYALR